ncbi:Sec-independent protein translocase subunit TatA [Nostocoides sp. F2B08]|uniref:Sec-independent protein translocase subunit TatA n=1 Tax=Nostocoides sp. F2B08 TaxID=2653936 RepID=UPI00126302CC|nr:Sec-independent protein translocase subunit TatA [Tetrasphaera sp. F2B08]KAB7742977.1 Sec-independent protein translocase subunit TatA [Tetrasphaera sp. F2B08]
MGGLRGQEILIIVILLILVFGWKRLPDAARSLGRSARVFKSEVEEMKKDGKSDASDETVTGQSSETRQSPQVAPPPPNPTQPGPAQSGYGQPHYEQPAQPQYQQPQASPSQQQPPDDPTRPVA